MEDVRGDHIKDYLPADYSDCFCSQIKATPGCSVALLFDSTFRNMPKSISMLLRLRDLIVRPFGLKPGVPFDELVRYNSEQEKIVGFEDKHLNFWVGLYCSPSHNEKRTVAITTIVKYNNWLGKVYFGLVFPFHRLLVRYQLRRFVETVND